MNVVIYARYSSSAQREESIDAQLRECKAFAKQQNMTVIGEYTDHALSGKTDKRPEFQRMIKDAEKHMFEGIVMYTLDRFARNRYDSAMYKFKLKKNGIKLFYAKQSIPDTPEGIILESILEGYAEYYSENLARNVTRGLRENALKGVYTGGTVAYGYDIDKDRKFVINEKEADIVRLIYKKYAEGNSISAIIKYLNEAGVKTKNNAVFRPNSLRTILSNRKYIGEYNYMDIMIKDAIPPIIENKLFEEVQSMRETSQKARSRTKATEDYLLTTKLFCGHCGSLMVGDSGTSKQGTTHRYYTCSKRKHHKACDKKSERKEELETIIIDVLVNKILTEDNIIRISAKVAEEYNKPDPEMIMLQDSLKKTQKGIDNLTKALLDGLVSRSVSAKLAELEADEKRIQERITELTIKKPPLTVDSVVKYLTTIRDGDMTKKRRLINLLVNRIYVYDNPEKKLVVLINTSENNRVVVTGSDIEQSGVRALQYPNLLIIKDLLCFVFNVTEFC